MARILIIEDDSILRENIKELLEFAGHQIVTAEDGQNGFQIALVQKFDLILCDIIMPGLDGYQVLKKLSSNSRTQRIPFIFLTAKSSLQEIRRGMNLGADDYITKPFEEKDLLDTINSRLARYAILKERHSNISENENFRIRSINKFKSFFLENGENFDLTRNDLLFRENQNVSYIFLIEKGLVKTMSVDEYGKELITGIYHDNDFIGLYSFNTNTTYPEQALVMENTRLFRLPVSLVQRIFKENPQLTLEWAQDLSKDVIKLKDHLLQTAYASVLKKTVNTILEFSEKLHFNKKELSKISRGDLASIAGISKESFIRSLSTLKQDGLIGINGKHIEVLNQNELRKIK